MKSISSVGYDLHARDFGPPNIASASLVRTLLSQAAADVEGAKFSPQFLLSEWSDVVDAWQLATWDAYANVTRLGRKTRLGGKQRELLWAIFERVRAGLAERKAVTWASVFGRLTDSLRAGRQAALRFCCYRRGAGSRRRRSRASSRRWARRDAERLFFAGDLGQRIFQQPFSWKALGIDVRGRSFTLRINYRTSHQIRSHADRLLPTTIGDVDGNAEVAAGRFPSSTVPRPRSRSVRMSAAEQSTWLGWIAARLREGYRPEEIGVFVRSDAQLDRARSRGDGSRRIAR